MRAPKLQHLIHGLALLAASATFAFAGWSADPVEIQATSALVPLVASVDDGQNGAVIVWQESTAGGGFLRAKHVLASGDIDPAWPAIAAVSSLDRTRGALGAVSDGQGGAYMWWTERSLLMMTHVGANGTVSAGWAAGGRNLGALYLDDRRPIVIADGAGGVYAAWLTMVSFGSSAADFRIMHIGPNGATAGGWPGSGRAFGLVGTNPSVVSFGLDRTTDGGLWLAWQTVQRVVPGVWGAGEERLLRLNTAGLPAAGWTSSGLLLAPFEPLNTGLATSAGGQQLALTRDGADGVYVVDAIGVPNGSGGMMPQQTLRHFDGSGAAFGGWDPAGVDLGPVTGATEFSFTAPASMRALADGRGGVYVGLPFFASEFTAMLNFSRFDALGGAQLGGIGTNQGGLEYALRSDGGMFIASFKPSGATGPFEADAYVGVSQSDGASFFESAPSASLTRYGDIGLSATRDGGAIFAWSQLIGRQGVYAIRLNPAGVVAGVEPHLGPASLRLRFVRGQGVLAVPSLAGVGRVTLALHDLAGRKVSSAVADGSPGASVTFPGTRDLAGGVYFARASAGGKLLHARVVVVR